MFDLIADLRTVFHDDRISKILPIMPMVLLEGLPVPTLRLYTAISFAVLSCSIYYASQIIKDPAWKTNNTHVDIGPITDGVTDVIPYDGAYTTDPRSYGTFLKELLECMATEPVCIWVCLILSLMLMVMLMLMKIVVRTKDL